MEESEVLRLPIDEQETAFSGRKMNLSSRVKFCRDKKLAPTRFDRVTSGL